jgi:hypothetical protein
MAVISRGRFRDSTHGPAFLLSSYRTATAGWLGIHPLGKVREGISDQFAIYLSPWRSCSAFSPSPHSFDVHAQIGGGELFISVVSG